MSGIFVFGALWSLAGSCWATEPWMPAPSSASGSPAYGATAAEMGGSHRFDLVVVQPQGRGPQGYRYRIVLDAATRGAISSLYLTADVGGLVVTARDVDGAGNDLDLVIKSAWSLTPVGVWINDHHGGFTKADTSVYAPSIWSDGPFMHSANSPDTFQGAILLWHQSYIHPSAQRCPGERWTRQDMVVPMDLEVRSRLTPHPPQTRAPPSLFSAHADLKVGAMSL